MKQENNNNDFLLTVDLFANAIGVSVETVRCWVRDNKVPSVKIGKRRLVNVQKLRDELDDWTQGNSAR